jgi:hypothetical protein
MTYLKDIKLCVECAFYGNHQGQRDRCVHPALTTTSLVTGAEDYPYCFAQRQSPLADHCGARGAYWVLHEESAAEREKKRQEFEEAMRDSPF